MIKSISKKVLALLLAIAFVFVALPKIPLANAIVFAAGEKQMQAAYAHVKPMIDAVLENGYEQPYANTESMITEVFKTEKKGAVARFRLLWDEDGLYLFTEVIDPVIAVDNTQYWLRDNVDVVLDELYKRTFPYDPSVVRIVIDAAGTEHLVSPDPDLQNGGFESAFLLTANGYNMEMFIPFLHLAPVIGDRVGFDIQISDDPGTGDRESMAAWSDYENIAYMDTSVLGTVFLVNVAEDTSVKELKLPDDYMYEDEFKPFTVDIDIDKEYQTIDGLGGNFAKQRFGPTNPSYGNALDDRGNDAVGEYMLDNLRPRFARVGLPLNVLAENETDAKNGVYNYEAGQLAGLYRLMQDIQVDGEQIIASVWVAPNWMLSPQRTSATDLSTGRTKLIPAMYEDFGNAIIAFAKHAKDNYGVDLNYVSLNEPDIGCYVLMTADEQVDLIKATGPLFQAAGLDNLKWLIGGAATISASRRYLRTMINRFDEIEAYTGPLAYNGWDGLNMNSIYLNEIRDMGLEVGRPVWCVENGAPINDALASWSYAMDYADVSHRVYAESGASSAMYWSYQNDYAFVSLSKNPFKAFYVEKHFFETLKPGTIVVDAVSDDRNVLALAGKGADYFNLQIINKNVYKEPEDVPPPLVGDVTNNLIANGGFEDGLTGWATYNVDLWTDNPNSGNSCLRLIANQWGPQISQVFNCEPNTDYVLSWYGRRSSANSAIVKITDGAPTYNVIFSDTPLATVSNRWQGREFKFNSGNNSRLTFHFTGDTGTYYLDDIVIIPDISEDVEKGYSKATINGLPNGIYEITRTSPDENFVDIGSYEVTDGTAEMTILCESVTLLSMKLDYAPGDKSALGALVGEAGALVEGDYTADSWATFAGALAGADDVMGAWGAAQEDVDEAYDALSNAVASLVRLNTAYIVVSGPATVESGPGAAVEYMISAKNAPEINGIELGFEVDGDYLASKDFTALGGLSFFGAGSYGTPILWSNAGNMWTGKATLLDLGALGIGGNPSGIGGDIDLLSLCFYVAEGALGETVFKLNYINISTAGGPVAVVIVNDEAKTLVVEYFSPFDLNKDRVVDLNDLTYALQFLLVAEGDANWDEAKLIDYNDDHIIDINDLIEILANYTIPYYS